MGDRNNVMNKQKYIALDTSMQDTKLMLHVVESCQPKATKQTAHVQKGR